MYELIGSTKEFAKACLLCCEGCVKDVAMRSVMRRKHKAILYNMVCY